MAVERVGGSDGPLEAWVAEQLGDGALHVLTLHVGADAPADPFGAWVVDGGVALFAALQRLLERSDGPLDVAIVLACGAPADVRARAACEAAVEAVRGGVHALTFELAGEARVNVVVCDGSRDDALAQTLRFIASPGGGYVAGSTFDLRAAS
jgi:hypothetical protein